MKVAVILQVQRDQKKKITKNRCPKRQSTLTSPQTTASKTDERRYYSP